MIDLVAHLHLRSISRGITLLAETEKPKFSTAREKVVVVVEETHFF